MIKTCTCGTEHASLGKYCSPECKIKSWNKNKWVNINPKKRVNEITKYYESKKHETV
jgi:hypothetical protein